MRKKIIISMVTVISAVLIIVLIAGVASSDKIEIPDGFKGEYINISGVAIRYYQIGSGQDLLFIHGLPGSLEGWQPIMKNLPSKYRVTVFDRPGHGFSSADNVAFNVEHNAKIALELIKKLKLKDVIVVGHSYGGATALAMAIRNPYQVKAFISISGASYPIEAGSHPMFNVVNLPVFGRGLAALLAPVIGKGMVDDGIRKAFHPNMDAIPSGHFEKRYKIWLQTKVLVTIAKEGLNMNEDIKKMIPSYINISKPFIIIHGSDDLYVPVEYSKKLHTKIKNSKLILLQDTGHQVQYPRSGVIIEAIENAANSTK